MGKRGPAPAPPGLKLLQGRSPGRDSGGRQVPETPRFTRQAPEPPDWLPANARDMWQRTVPELERLGLLKESDIGVLTSYCIAWSQLVVAVKAYQAEGFAMTNRRSGSVKVNPAVAAARAAMKDVLVLARELGCTPSAEANLSMLPTTSDDDESNPFSPNYRP